MNTTSKTYTSLRNIIHSIDDEYIRRTLINQLNANYNYDKKMQLVKLDDEINTLIKKKEKILNKMEVCSDELLNSISFDPFVQKGLIKKNDEFLKDYYEISRFLLHGNDYLKIIKIQHKVLSGSLYKKALADERIYIIDKFRHNNILKKFGINNSDIVKNEKNNILIHTPIMVR